MLIGIHYETRIQTFKSKLFWYNNYTKLLIFNSNCILSDIIAIVAGEVLKKKKKNRLIISLYQNFALENIPRIGNNWKFIFVQNKKKSLSPRVLIKVLMCQQQSFQARSLFLLFVQCTLMWFYIDVSFTFSLICWRNSSYPIDC